MSDQSTRAEQYLDRNSAPVEVTDAVRGTMGPAADTPISGLDWLNRLTFDVFCHVIWFLDERGVSALSSTCKAFQENIDWSKAIWLRVLRVLSYEQSIAPHSLEHLRSVFDLKAAATRYTRSRAALSDQHRPWSIRVNHCFLDHHEIFDSTSARSMPLTLLAGGRWLLSLAIHGGSSYVICWDVQRGFLYGSDPAKSSYYSFQPAAYLELNNVSFVYRGSWAHVQATIEADGAMIAVCTRANGTGLRADQIIQLSWTDNDSTPSFLSRANLDNHSKFLPGLATSPCVLAGDYLAIESTDGILVWNWKDDTIGTVYDPERKTWAGTTGFWMSLQPPFIHVFRNGFGCIVTIPMPALVARSSYAGHSTMAAQSFPTNFIRCSKPVVLNRWQPDQLRPSVVVAPCGDSDYIVYFSSTNEQSMPPRCREQPEDRFNDISLSSINVVGPYGHALVGPICPVTWSVLLSKSGSWVSDGLLPANDVNVAIASFDCT